MESKTAMQQAIETIKSSLQSYEETLAKEPNNAFIAGRCDEKQGVIDYLTSLLPTEKEQIEQAGNKCQIVNEVDVDGNIDFMYQSGEEYFTNTYGQTND